MLNLKKNVKLQFFLQESKARSTEINCHDLCQIQVELECISFESLYETPIDSFPFKLLPICSSTWFFAYDVFNFNYLFTHISKSHKIQIDFFLV